MLTWWGEGKAVLAGDLLLDRVPLALCQPGYVLFSDFGFHQYRQYFLGTFLNNLSGYYYRDGAGIPADINFCYKLYFFSIAYSTPLAEVLFKDFREAGNDLLHPGGRSRLSGIISYCFKKSSSG